MKIIKSFQTFITIHHHPSLLFPFFQAMFAEGLASFFHWWPLRGRVDLWPPFPWPRSSYGCFVWSMFQWIFNGCSMDIQWMFILFSDIEWMSSGLSVVSWWISQGLLPRSFDWGRPEAPTWATATFVHMKPAKLWNKMDNFHGCWFQCV